jgi:hypothetical protein
MKRILRITLPSICLLVIGVCALFVISGCGQPDEGTLCAVCVDNSQCNDGLYCYDPGNGEVPKCKPNAGYLCN